MRDIYDIDANTMLLIATDRLSAFDVILPTPIKDEGCSDGCIEGLIKGLQLG